MFNDKEKEILEYAKTNGVSAFETKQALARYRQEQTNVSEPSQQPKSFMQKAEGIGTKVANTLGLGGATKTFGNVIARSRATEENKQFIDKPTTGQVIGAGLQTAAIPAGALLTGGASVLGKVAVGAGLGYAYDVGQDLVDKKSAKEVATPGMGTVIGGALPVAFKGASLALGASKPLAQKTAQAISNTASKALPSNATTQGVKQVASDLAERVPRFVSRVQTGIEEASVKSASIKNAPTPQVRQALKVELPEKYINTVTKADDATRKAYKQVLDIAEEQPTSLGSKKNPTIVGGELASKQYDLIDAHKRKIGEGIGEQVKLLTKNKARVDMRVSFSQIDDVLEQQGITIGAKNKLVFTGKYTPAERARIQELYTLSREGGSVMSPTKVRDIDQLFSKLQRETRMEGLSDLRVDVNGESMSMFRIFRDIYGNQLENLSPELKRLNAQYRNISTLTDDIEDSIIKTPNFNITKSTDKAEFAKVNLRRIFGESQSSPVYEAIADEMDVIARKLGYKDATPKEVAAFAQELRELYPDTLPSAGFAGGIRSGVSGLVDTALSVGEANKTDQQKALRALIEANGSR